MTITRPHPLTHYSNTPLLEEPPKTEFLAAPKQKFRLVTADQTPQKERIQDMSTPETNQPSAVCRMWNGNPLSNHGAFQDIEESQRLLSMGCNALKGIGAMLLPGTEAANSETGAKRLELSEIFSFFGEVLGEHSLNIGNAVFRIERAANGYMS